MQELTDPAAERAVLSAVYNYGQDAYVEVGDLLQTTSFTIDSNQAFWKCLEHILKDKGTTKPDLPSIMSAARTVGCEALLATPEERKHLRAVTQMSVERGNIRTLAGKVRKLQVARELRDELRQADASLGTLTGDEAIETILAMAENPVFDYICRISSTSTGGSMLGDGIEDYVQYLIDNPVSQVGISSGYRHFDKAIGGGFRKGTVSVVGARMKVGKSQFGMNVANYVSGDGRIPVWYGDTELGKKDHWNRLLANLANIDTNDIECGVFGKDPGQVAMIRAAAKKLKDAPYRYECIAGRPFEETMSLMRRWVLREVGLGEDGLAKDCLMVFDYLKLMDSTNVTKQLAEYQVLGFMMTALHNFAVRYQLPVVALVQLNRDGIESEETDAVSGSDRIGWLCSNLSLLKVQSVEEQAEQAGSEVVYTHKLVPLVSRHGACLPKGEFIHMNAEYKYGRLREGPLRSELGRKSVVNNKGFEVEVDEHGEIQP